MTNLGLPSVKFEPHFISKRVQKIQQPENKFVKMLAFGKVNYLKGTSK